MTAVEYTLFEAYNKQQLCEIMKGMEQNVDVIQYADPRYSDWQMWKIREALNDGLDVTCLLDHRWNDEMTSVLQFALYDGMDLSSYADKGFSAAQIQVIHKGFRNGIDVEAYAYTIYSSEQMNQLRQALEEGVSIFLLNDPRYTPEIMSLIRTAAKDGYDVAGKFEPSMSYEEISQELLAMANERNYARYVVSRDLRQVEQMATTENELLELLRKKGYEITQNEDLTYATPPDHTAPIEIEHSAAGYGYIDDAKNKVYYSLPFWQSEEFDVLWQRVSKRESVDRER